MAVNIKEFTELKKTVEQLNEAAARARGAYEQSMVRLKAEFGCDTIEEAEELAEQKDKEADKAAKEFEEAITAFEEEWKDVLQQLCHLPSNR